MKVQQIKADSIIKFELSTLFYKRLQDLAIYFHSTIPGDDVKEIIAKIQKNEDLDEVGSCMETLWILLATIEKNAKEQGFIEDVDMNV